MLTNLVLWNNSIGPTGATALADALKVNGVLKNINLRGNSLGTEGWCAIFAALRDNKENKIESWHLSGQGINTEIAKVLAEYVSVSGVLTCLNVGYNNLGGETDYIKASEVEGESKEVGDKVIYEGREMIVSKGVDSDGDLKLIDAVQSGVLAIAKALEVNEVLTSLDVSFNHLGYEGKGAIRDAVSGREGFKLEM